MKKRIIILLMALTASVSLMACGKDKEPEAPKVLEPETEVSDAGTEDTTENEVLPEGKYRSELTNELIDDSLKNQRPIAVMVDNESIALPHYGLSQADVVYEMMNSTLNGRITRFMVLVKDWDQIKQLGSIRSVRPTNVFMAAEWNAIICHDGGPFYVDQYIEDPGIDHFSGTFSRIKNGKPTEYTEYIVPGDLEKNFKNSKVSKEYTSYYEGAHYQFANEDNPVDLSGKDGVKDAAKIELPFQHNGSYLEYDADKQVYYYFEYGKAHVDPGNDNQQLNFKNLLIQKCDFIQYDEHGYMIFKCTGTGEGYYLTNGKAMPVSWSKDNMNKPTRYFDAEGNEIKINTGKTYVGFVPSDDWEDLVIE